MKLLFLYIFSINAIASFAQNKVSLTVNSGLAYTFHRPYNYDDGMNLIEVGKKKGL